MSHGKIGPTVIDPIVMREFYGVWINIPKYILILVWIHIVKHFYLAAT